MKNNINKLTDDELLGALEGAKESDIVSDQSEIVRFLHTFKIDEGSNKVKGRVIYNLYTKWSKQPVIKNKFYQMLSYLFNPQKGYYYLTLGTKQMTLLAEKEIKPKRDKTKSPYYKEHFESFLDRFHIRKGFFGMKLTVLWDVYTTWHKASFKKDRYILQELLFEEFFKLYFKTKLDHNNTYILISPHILDHMTYNQKLKCLSPKAQKNAIKKENKKKSN